MQKKVDHWHVECIIRTALGSEQWPALLLDTEGGLDFQTTLFVFSPCLKLAPSF